jgi:hypothetical protein
MWSSSKNPNDTTSFLPTNIKQTAMKPTPVDKDWSNASSFDWGKYFNAVGYGKNLQNAIRNNQKGFQYSSYYDAYAKSLLNKFEQERRAIAQNAKQPSLSSGDVGVAKNIFKALPAITSFMNARNNPKAGLGQKLMTGVKAADDLADSYKNYGDAKTNYYQYMRLPNAVIGGIEGATKPGVDTSSVVGKAQQLANIVKGAKQGFQYYDKRDPMNTNQNIGLKDMSGVFGNLGWKQREANQPYSILGTKGALDLYDIANFLGTAAVDPANVAAPAASALGKGIGAGVRAAGRGVQAARPYGQALVDTVAQGNRNVIGFNGTPSLNNFTSNFNRNLQQRLAPDTGGTGGTPNPTSNSAKNGGIYELLESPAAKSLVDNLTSGDLQLVLNSQGEVSPSKVSTLLFGSPRKLAATQKVLDNLTEAAFLTKQNGAYRISETVTNNYKPPAPAPAPVTTPATATTRTPLAEVVSKLNSKPDYEITADDLSAIASQKGVSVEQLLLDYSKNSNNLIARRLAEQGLIKIDTPQTSTAVETPQPQPQPQRTKPKSVAEVEYDKSVSLAKRLGRVPTEDELVTQLGLDAQYAKTVVKKIEETNMFPKPTPTATALADDVATTPEPQVAEPTPTAIDEVPEQVETPTPQRTRTVRMWTPEKMEEFATTVADSAEKKVTKASARRVLKGSRISDKDIETVVARANEIRQSRVVEPTAESMIDDLQRQLEEAGARQQSALANDVETPIPTAPDRPTPTAIDEPTPTSKPNTDEEVNTAVVDFLRNNGRVPTVDELVNLGISRESAETWKKNIDMLNNRTATAVDEPATVEPTPVTPTAIDEPTPVTPTIDEEAPFDDPVDVGDESIPPTPAPTDSTLYTNPAHQFDVNGKTGYYLGDKPDLRGTFEQKELDKSFIKRTYPPLALGVLGAAGAVVAANPQDPAVIVKRAQAKSDATKAISDTVKTNEQAAQNTKNTATKPFTESEQAMYKEIERLQKLLDASIEDTMNSGSTPMQGGESLMGGQDMSILQSLYQPVTQDQELMKQLSSQISDEYNRLMGGYDSRIRDLRALQDADLNTLRQNRDIENRKLDDNMFQRYMQTQENMNARGLLSSGLMADATTKTDMARKDAMADIAQRTQEQMGQTNRYYSPLMNAIMAERQSISPDAMLRDATDRAQSQRAQQAQLATNYQQMVNQMKQADRDYQLRLDEFNRKFQEDSTSKFNEETANNQVKFYQNAAKETLAEANRVEKKILDGRVNETMIQSEQAKATELFNEAAKFSAMAQQIMLTRRPFSQDEANNFTVPTKGGTGGGLKNLRLEQARQDKFEGTDMKALQRYVNSGVSGLDPIGVGNWMNASEAAKRILQSGMNPVISPENLLEYQRYADGNTNMWKDTSFLGKFSPFGGGTDYADVLRRQKVAQEFMKLYNDPRYKGRFSTPTE